MGPFLPCFPVVGVITTGTELGEQVLQGRVELLLRYCVRGDPVVKLKEAEARGMDREAENVARTSGQRNG